jgi:imidazolonepropionase-like amidohydrolase
VNAEIVRQVGKLGELVPGAFADLLVVDGDPYRDLGVFRSDGGRLDAIMANGTFVHNRL